MDFAVVGIEFFEEFPSDYLVSTSRQQRWARGDWQLLPWIFGRRSGHLAVPSIGRGKMLDLEGLDVERAVYAYGVAGRQRSMAANTLIKMLRAADWRSVEGTATLAVKSAQKSIKALRA